MSALAAKKGDVSDVMHLDTLRNGLDTLIFNFRGQGHLVTSKYNQYLDQLRKFRPKLELNARGREYLYMAEVHLETLGARVARVIEIDACLREVNLAFAVLRRAEIAWHKSMPDHADRHWVKAQEASGFLKGDLADHPEVVEYAERFMAFREVMEGRASTLAEISGAVAEGGGDVFIVLVFFFFVCVSFFTFVGVAGC
jgi:hypothetical protein